MYPSLSFDVQKSCTDDHLNLINVHFHFLTNSMQTLRKNSKCCNEQLHQQMGFPD